MSHLEQMTRWYCELVKAPGWREYVLGRVKYMADKQPMYLPLKEAVDQASKEQS
jgi:hypothetical protein